MCVFELADILAVPQSSVSRHVQVVRRSGLLESERHEWLKACGIRPSTRHTRDGGDRHRHLEASSRHLDEFLEAGVDTVITVCGNADQARPMFPGHPSRHHFPFDDPAHATGSEQQQLAMFRRVRDEIRTVFEAYAAGRLDERRAAQTARSQA